jgi:type IV secretory pathway VirB10-like protein
MLSPSSTSPLDPPATAADPHAPKMRPDDPRLRVDRPRSRTLRSGPLLALVAGLLAAIMVAIAFALQPTGGRTHDASEAATAGPAQALAPEAIRNAPAAPRPMPARLADAGAFSTGGYGRSGEADPSSPESQRTLRVEQEFKAQSAGILFESAAPPSEDHDPFEAARTAPTAASAEAMARAPSTEDSDPNLQAQKNAFLDTEGATKTHDYLQTRLQHPRSPYEVKAGTIIPALLITAINSDLPGPVIGQVRENVYDTVSGNYLLIPQGARLIAHYDSNVAWGQERVLVCWNRLVFPNGDSVGLECMPAADLAGAAGLTDEVNEHWVRILKGAAVASLLAATTQYVAGNTTGYNPTVPQMWAHGAADNINQVGQQITGRNLNIQPTITVRPGFSVNVIVTKDLVLPTPYRLDAR